MNVYGQHMERLQRQERCSHVWSEWRPYPDNPALEMRDCKRCWKVEGRKAERLEPWEDF